VNSCPFPVGYGRFFQIDPNTIYPSTKWEQKKDVFILAAGETYPAGSTGGEAQHTLTVAEMPIHEHDVYVRVQGYDGWKTYTSSNYGVMFKKNADATGYHNPNYSAKSASVTADAKTGYSGGGQPHNNMPPYFAMPFWIRTA
jgi:microcystin-dependent protein